MRRRRRVNHQRIDHRGQLGDHLGPQQLPESITGRAPAPRCRAIIALSPRIGVYSATASTCRSRCETSAATGVPIEIPDTTTAVALRPRPAHHRADLRHRPHHARDIAQWIHVRIARPLPATTPVAGLNRHRDVESQPAMDPVDSRQQHVLRAALTGAVYPDQPRPSGQSRCRHRCTTAVAGPPKPSADQRLRQGRIMLERHPLIGNPAMRRRCIERTRSGCGSACAPSIPSADNSSAAARAGFSAAGCSLETLRPAPKSRSAQAHPASLHRIGARRAATPGTAGRFVEAGHRPRQHHAQFAG